jgi:thioredoxin reductase (NADPH)
LGSVEMEGAMMMADSTVSPARLLIETRFEQMFPKLDALEIERLRRFGETQTYARGEHLVTAGDVSPGMFIILSGEVALTQHSALGGDEPIVRYVPGSFMGEVAQLSGRPSLTDARATKPVEALVIPSRRLRDVLVAEAEVGERIMRALILRRVGLIQSGLSGPLIVGRADHPSVLRLAGFLGRNGHPQQRLDPETDASAKALIERFDVEASELPIVLCPNGRLLRNPTEVELPVHLGPIPDGDGARFELLLANDERVRARTVVIASGARYRRLDVENLSAFEGSSVHYWASPLEAKLCAGHEVALVGAGNGAGQAVVYLASEAQKVWLLARGRSLDASMSRYLVERIAGLPNVEVRLQTEVSALEGRDGALEAIRWRHTPSGAETRRSLHFLFLFIGADPNTSWLAESGVALDAKGFVRTGADVGAGRRALETSLDGVFAIGDVREGSTKRVAAAVGEGAQVIATIHAHLAAQPTAGVLREGA